MYHRAIASGLRWFVPCYAACIVSMSAQTLRQAHGLADHHFWLPIVERLGAVMLAIGATRAAGLVLLLLVYGFALIVRAHHGDFAVDLILYAATAILIYRTPAASDGPAGSA
jgi:hypothetical protein